LLKQLEASKYLSIRLMNADMDTATTLTPIQVAGAVAVSHLDTASGELHRLSRGWNMGNIADVGCSVVQMYLDIIYIWKHKKVF
jgi:hypothetical protein